MGQRRGAPPLGVPRQSAVGPQRIRAVSVFANPTNAVGLGLLPQANGVRSIKRAGVVVRDEEVVGSKLSARRMGRLTRLLNGRRVGGVPFGLIAAPRTAQRLISLRLKRPARWALSSQSSVSEPQRLTV